MFTIPVGFYGVHEGGPAPLQELTVWMVNPDALYQDEKQIVTEEMLASVTPEAYDTPLYPNPLAYWSMNNSDFVTIGGTEYLIENLNGHNFKVSGSITKNVDGISGRAITLGPSSGFLDLTGSENIVFNDSGVYSVSMWFKPDSGVTTIQYLLDVFNSDVSGKTATFAYRRDSNNILSYTVFGSPTWVETTGSLKLDDWNHVIMTFDSANDVFKYHLNGTKETVTPTGLVPFTTSSFSLVRLGARRANAVNQVNGEIDEVAIFNSDLTDSEAEEIYKKGLQGLKLIG